MEPQGQKAHGSHGQHRGRCSWAEAEVVDRQSMKYGKDREKAGARMPDVKDVAMERDEMVSRIAINDESMKVRNKEKYREKCQTRALFHACCCTHASRESHSIDDWYGTA